MSSRVHVAVVAALSILGGAMFASPAVAAYPGPVGRIVYEQANDLWSVNPDGSDQVDITGSPDRAECNPTVSPDGTLVAFTLCEGGTRSGDLVVMDMATGQEFLVEQPDRDAYGFQYPTWSPDGTHLAATALSFSSGSWRRLYVVDLETFIATAVTPDGYNTDYPTWSVNGEIYHVVDGDVWAVVPGGTPRQITTEATRPNRDFIEHLDASPDGTQLAFSQSTDGVWIMDVDGSNVRELIADSPRQDYYLFDPAWSPSGEEVVALADVDALGNGDLYVFSAAGSFEDRRRITSLPGLQQAASWGVDPGDTAPTDPGTPTDPGPAPDPAGSPFDGDPATTGRIDRDDPTAAAVEISRARFLDSSFAGTQPQQTRSEAAWVVLSRDDEFADSLAGSSLVGLGPLLLTDQTTLTPTTAAEIERVLPSGGLVYLLGGEGAIASGVAADLAGRGFDVRRLAGPSRVETALAVADEARAVFQDQGLVLLARDRGTPENPSAGWADSVSGGGLAAFTGQPVLVTPTGSLHPAVQTWLERDAAADVVLLGGTAALSTTVEQSVGPAASRVSGDDRAATAAEISRQLWGIDETTSPRSFVIVNGGHPQGWAFALAATGLSADHGAPVLLTTPQSVPPATAQMVTECGPPQVELAIIGGEAVVPASVAGELDSLDGGC